MLSNGGGHFHCEITLQEVPSKAPTSVLSSLCTKKKKKKKDFSKALKNAC